MADFWNSTWNAQNPLATLPGTPASGGGVYDAWGNVMPVPSVWDSLSDRLAGFTNDWLNYWQQNYWADRGVQTGAESVPDLSKTAGVTVGSSPDWVLVALVGVAALFVIGSIQKG